MRAFGSFLKATLIGGLLFLVPVVLLLVILEKALHLAEKFVAPVAHHFPQFPIIGVTGATFAAVIVLLLVSFLAGLIAQTDAGRRFAEWVERVFLSKMPGYTMMRATVGDLTGTLDQLGGDNDTRAVLVRIEDAWQLGFVVDTLASGELAVFVPGAPSPLSGSLYFMPPERVRDSGLSVLDATAMLRRIGVGSAARLKGCE